MRTRALWMMCGAQLCGSLGAQSASFHWVPHFGQVGFNPVTVATMLSVYTMAAAFSAGMWGFLSERFSERMLAMITMSCGFCLVLSMMLADNVVWAMVTVGLFGLSSRGETAMFSLVLARFFGRESFGRIAGVVHPFGAVGASLAPLLGGVIFDMTGHYSALYGTLAVVYVTAFTCLLLAADPQKNLPPVAEPTA